MINLHTVDHQVANASLDIPREEIAAWLQNISKNQTFVMMSNRKCIIASYLRYRFNTENVSVGVGEAMVNGKHYHLSKWLQGFISLCIHLSITKNTDTILTVEDALEALERIKNM